MTPRVRQWQPLVRSVAATILVGAVAGAVVGGVGGRLAMRILFLTSNERVKGVKSDDGFEIGTFSAADTFGLIVFAAIVGIAGALVHFAAMPVVRRLGAAHAPVATVFFGVAGGAVIVHRGGVDFTLLEPALLAIALFVALCAAFGAVTASPLRRVTEDGAWPQTARPWLVGPPLVALVFPPVLVLAVVATAIHVATTPTGERRTWAVVGPVVAVVLGLAFVVACVDLVRDTAALV